MLCTSEISHQWKALDSDQWALSLHYELSTEIFITYYRSCHCLNGTNLHETVDLNTERFISCNWSRWSPLMTDEMIVVVDFLLEMMWIFFLNKIWSDFKQDWNWTKCSLTQEFESRLQPVRSQLHNYICFNITSTSVCRIKVKQNKMFCEIRVTNLSALFPCCSGGIRAFFHRRSRSNKLQWDFLEHKLFPSRG